MTALITMIRSYWIITTLFLLAVITLLSLTPLPGLPAMHGNDKSYHFIAYGALIFPAALRQTRHWLLIALFFVLWSAGVELFQPYVNRHAEWLDMAANVAGIVCGLLLAILINWIFPVRLKHK